MSLRDLDPLSPSFLEDPYASFRLLRDEAPVHFVESRKMWIVTRYDDIVAAARNPAVFSSTGGVGYDWNQRPMMPMYDPPEHTRMRRIVARHFTPAAINAFKPRVQALVDDIVARALEAGDVDVVNDIALPLSLGTVAELLGIPPSLRAQLRRWSQGTVEDLAGGLAPIAGRRVDELRREFNVYLRSLIEERRAALSRPTESIDVITALVAAGEDEKLTSRELVAFCVLLLVAGYETTVNAISNGVLALLEHPDELAKLRREPGLLRNAVEEIVRYDSPVLSFFRNTLSDTTLSGQTIPKGSKVMLAFASANRDERKFPDPDVFRIDREPGEHLAYGSGVHFCLGAPLARLQLMGIFGALVQHVGTIEMASKPPRTASVLFRGVKTFPVHITPAGQPPLARESAPSLDVRRALAPTPKLEVVPFRVHAEDDVLDDLKTRLARVRWPDEIEWAGWDYGTSLGYLRTLVEHWRDRYDWRTHEAKVNELPQFRARIDDLDVHFVHVRSPKPTAPPLLLLHGWPGPFWLFSRLVAILRNEPRDLVVGSLPGFPFSSAAHTRGMGTMKMAEVFVKLMSGLGYDRYGIVAEDWGAGVASRIGLAHPARVVGLHLNMPHENPPRDQMGQLSEEERAWLREMGRFRGRELTHFPVHERQPQSLAYGLTDSPVGLCGWLVDKYRAWSDSDGDVETAFSKDDLLTNVMLYWLSGSIASSIRVYYESRQLPWFLASGERIDVPTAIALTKHELVQPPRRWIERVYNLERLTHVPAGGHFGAWEQPTAIADDVRAFFDGRR